MTADQAVALLRVAQEDDYLGPYVILSLTTGIRTEEARALRWDHVSTWMVTLAPECRRISRCGGRSGPGATRRPSGPGAPWDCRRVRSSALREQRKRQAAAQLAAGELWQDHGLVFTSSTGKPLDVANVGRGFRALCEKAGVGGSWSPRELRHTFVSLMSESGIAVEEIARLAGHSSSRTTEVVYRHELRPVITTGADAMDKMFDRHARTAPG